MTHDTEPHKLFMKELDTMQNEEPMRVTRLNEFMEWTQQLPAGEYLFRGVPNEKYEIQASAYRRPKEEDRDFEKFFQINKSLIRDVRLLGYDERNGRELRDLEILAELQHFGAATCLIDFTYSAQVALWFACQLDAKPSQDLPPPNGKVFAVHNKPSRFKEITPKMLKKRINYFLQGNEGERALSSISYNSSSYINGSPGSRTTVLSLSNLSSCLEIPNLMQMPNVLSWKVASKIFGPNYSKYQVLLKQCCFLILMALRVYVVRIYHTRNSVRLNIENVVIRHSEEVNIAKQSPIMTRQSA